jgi:hypothetical protein
MLSTHITGAKLMAKVRIYQPSKTAMQSGKGKTKKWLMEFETKDPMATHSLMGWVSSQDTSQQLHLTFSCLREAISYAKEKGLIYTVYNPTQLSSPPKSYGINFTCSRIRGC